METIVPCRNIICERFPIASFSVRIPQSRYYEVVCATDPRLFHTDFAGRRTPDNFYSSRSRGLLVASRDGDAFILPAEQLRRFAGARRLYYALGSYGGRNGEAPRFSIAPDALEHTPCVSLAPDFTGKSLDRTRLGETTGGRHGYGGARTVLRWGGDAVLEAERTRARTRTVSGTFGYDDGFDPNLWRGPGSSNGHAAAPSEEVELGDYAGDAGIPSDLGAELESGEPEARAQGRGRPRARGRAPFRGWDRPRASTRDEGRAPSSYGRPHARAQVDEPMGAEDGAEQHRRYGARGGTPISATARRPVVATYGGASSVRPPAYRPPLRSRAVALPATYGRVTSTSGRHPAYHDDERTAGLGIGPAGRALSVEPLTIAKKVEILRVVARSESGNDGYSAVNPDNEYNDPNHPAYQAFHIGLSWGFIQFTQRGGALGRVLAKAKQREEALAAAGDLEEGHAFEAVFGPAWQALLETTDPERTSTEEGRVAPVDGTPLWEEPWLSRFVAAGQIPYVQAAQNEVAVVRYFDRMLPIARGLGIRTPRGVALLVDRAIHMGVGGGRGFVMDTVGPVRTEQDRAAGLAALGHGDDLRAFQQAHGLTVDGQWGPMSHAAMTGALRGLGASSPVPIPSAEAMIETLAEAARTAGYARRIDALMNNQTDFDDTVQLDLG